MNCPSVACVRTPTLRDNTTTEVCSASSAGHTTNNIYFSAITTIIAVRTSAITGKDSHGSTNVRPSRRSPRREINRTPVYTRRCSR
jgi:hypothetical protein